MWKFHSLSLTAAALAAALFPVLAEARPAGGGGGHQVRGGARSSVQGARPAASRATPPPRLNVIANAGARNAAVSNRQANVNRGANVNRSGNRVNTGNVNVGNNVNIDVDHDNGWGWGDRVWTWHEAADLRLFRHVSLSILHF